jgi:hypothetical protein
MRPSDTLASIGLLGKGEMFAFMNAVAEFPEKAAQVEKVVPQLKGVVKLATEMAAKMNDKQSLGGLSGGTCKSGFTHLSDDVKSKCTKEFEAWMAKLSVHIPFSQSVVYTGEDEFVEIPIGCVLPLTGPTVTALTNALVKEQSILSNKPAVSRCSKIPSIKTGGTSFALGGMSALFGSAVSKLLRPDEPSGQEAHADGPRAKDPFQGGTSGAAGEGPNAHESINDRMSADMRSLHALGFLCAQEHTSMNLGDPANREYIRSSSRPLGAPSCSLGGHTESLICKAMANDSVARNMPPEPPRLQVHANFIERPRVEAPPKRAQNNTTQPAGKRPRGERKPDARPSETLHPPKMPAAITGVLDGKGYTQLPFSSMLVDLQVPMDADGRPVAEDTRAACLALAKHKDMAWAKLAHQDASDEVAKGLRLAAEREVQAELAKLMEEYSKLVGIVTTNMTKQMRAKMSDWYTRHLYTKWDSVSHMVESIRTTKPAERHTKTRLFCGGGDVLLRGLLYRHTALIGPVLIYLLYSAPYYPDLIGMLIDMVVSLTDAKQGDTVNLYILCQTPKGDKMMKVKNKFLIPYFVCLVLSYRLGKPMPEVTEDVNSFYSRWMHNVPAAAVVEYMQLLFPTNVALSNHIHNQPKEENKLGKGFVPAAKPLKLVPGDGSHNPRGEDTRSRLEPRDANEKRPKKKKKQVTDDPVGDISGIPVAQPVDQRLAPTAEAVSVHPVPGNRPSPGKSAGSMSFASAIANRRL